MALGDPYITMAELKGYMTIDPSDTQYDQRLTDAVNSASREIEQFTGRQFNKSTSATTRRYEPDSVHSVTVDDFWTTTGLVIETDPWREGAWTAVTSTDYELYPIDGVVDGVPGWPYYRITVPDVLRTYGRGYYSRRISLVRVTAQWGWSAVPASVKQAALQLGAETFKLAEAPFGVAGSDQFGGVVRVRDLPQVARKLNRFVTTPIMVG